MFQYIHTLAADVRRLTFAWEGAGASQPHLPHASGRRPALLNLPRQGSDCLPLQRTCPTSDDSAAGDGAQHGSVDGRRRASSASGTAGSWPAGMCGMQLPGSPGASKARCARQVGCMQLPGSPRTPSEAKAAWQTSGMQRPGSPGTPSEAKLGWFMEGMHAMSPVGSPRRAPQVQGTCHAAATACPPGSPLSGEAGRDSRAVPPGSPSAWACSPRAWQV